MRFINILKCEHCRERKGPRELRIDAGFLTMRTSSVEEMPPKINETLEVRFRRPPFTAAPPLAGGENRWRAVPTRWLRHGCYFKKDGASLPC